MRTIRIDYAIGFAVLALILGFCAAAWMLKPPGLTVMQTLELKEKYNECVKRSGGNNEYCEVKVSSTRPRYR